PFPFPGGRARPPSPSTPSVALPEPDGPQRTIFSPWATARSMSLSTWKRPNHLPTPRISIIEALAISVLPQHVRPAARQLALRVLAVARHGEAEGEVHQRREDVGFDAEAAPRRLGQGHLDGGEEVKEADDHHQRSILEKGDEGLHH